ncbi:cytochrome P450 [Mycena alexandri]|uniref:Cytochrome P450 n=1 Tax=Mycena alexandri TaxID=1745969 RepID=A0AAD6WR43_9AGAR|nr:cytochrome P450 [Mycena alexandri]
MPSLLTNAALTGFALTTFVFTRFVIRVISARLCLRHIPGPTSTSLLWGEEWNLYHDAPGSHYIEWHQQFGKIVKFRGACGHQILSITDERAVAFIVGDGIYRFPKPDGVRVWFQKTLGEGILWIEGKEAHEKQRRSLAPALTPQSVRKFTPIFYETSAKLAAQWTKILDNSESDKVEIEVTNWAGRFAFDIFYCFPLQLLTCISMFSLDTVARAAFSYDFNLLSGEPNALAEALDGLTNNENKLSSFYMRALFWVFPAILSIGKKGEMIRRVKAELGAIACQMWRDAKIALDAHSTDNDKTLMALMLKADTMSSQQLHEDEIVAQMRTVLSAGYETVSAIVAWVLYELAMSPQLQEKLREEISSPGDPSLDELNNQFPILDSVILETLRLHPAILENHHQAAETISVPLAHPIPGSSVSQLVIPKGTVLSIPVNVLQMDPEIWGEDAHLFRPERWHSSDSTRHNLFAFSEGPRSCIGKRFALAEIKALTLTLIRQFSFTCSHEIEAIQSFVIRPRIKGQGISSLPLTVRRV